MSPGDDVATALRDLSRGERVRAGSGPELAVADDTPRGHKLAVRPLARGAAVRKYGWPIGEALCEVPAGGHVHTHNLRTRLQGEEAYAFAAARTGPMPFAEAEARIFDGYRRADGRTGTRNEVWGLPTVGCVGRTAQRIAAEAHARFAGRGVDGVYAFTHPFGCSQLGEDLAATRAILADLARHPNAGGVLLVGLGCENNQLGALLASAAGLDPARVRSFAAQGVDDELEVGVEAVEALVATAAARLRATASAAPRRQARTGPRARARRPPP